MLPEILARLTMFSRQLRRAGEQGHADAQVNLGSLFENCYGNGPCNSEEAANWYRRAASQGDAIAQYNLGVMYGLGGLTPAEVLANAKTSTLEWST